MKFDQQCHRATAVVGARKRRVRIEGVQISLCLPVFTRGRSRSEGLLFVSAPSIIFDRHDEILMSAQS